MTDLFSFRRRLCLKTIIGGVFLAGGLAWLNPLRAGSLADSLAVIPQPREVKAAGAPFDPAKARFICVSDTTGDRFAARLVQEAARRTHGIDCDIVLLPRKSTTWHRLWLGPAQESPDTTPMPSANEAEGYGLGVNSSGALVAAASDAGLFYGAQTLIQLLEQSRRDNAGIPGMTITDWPAFGWRARYFDASQYFGSIVATRANLEREIQLLARYKMNWLCFEAYNFVPFKSFPACANANTLSLADWNYLVELAQRQHVTLVPSLQSFAQMYDVIWNCDEGRPYREETAPGLICPSRPGNVKFLQGLYGDLISIFKYSPVLGIGCSETGMQWQKHYCPLCRARIEKGETFQDIYCRHVRDCVVAVDAAAKEAGRTVRPMMWGDEFYMGYDGKRWDGIEMIPTNTVMGHWMYWPGYEGIAGLLERHFDVFFLSASYQHNVYLVDLSPQDPVDGKWAPLLNSGIRNIAGQARQAASDNQKGLPGKVLGGGCATFSQHDIRSWDTTWFAYVLQSEYSWNNPPGQFDDELNRFTDKFAAVFYDAHDRETAQAIASAYRDLDAVKSDLERNNYLIRDIIGIYDVQDTCYTGNTLEGSLKLIDDLAAHPLGPEKTVADIRARCEHALAVAAASRQKLALVASHAGNIASMDFLMSAPRKIENHAHRTLLLLDMAEAFQKMHSAKNTTERGALRPTMARLQKQCAELRNVTQIIADEMDELTQGADPTGYHKALASLDEFAKRLQEADAALAEHPQK